MALTSAQLQLCLQTYWYLWYVRDNWENFKISFYSLFIG